VNDRDAFGNPIAPGAAPPLQPAAPPPPPPGGTTTSAMDGDSLAWMSLGCAIGGWLLIPFVLPIVAIVLARRVRPQLGPGAPRSATTAALWIAWTNIVLCVLFVAFMVIAIASFWDTRDF
jgi:hypothetical protein